MMRKALALLFMLVCTSLVQAGQGFVFDGNGGKVKYGGSAFQDQVQVEVTEPIQVTSEMSLYDFPVAAIQIEPATGKRFREWTDQDGNYAVDPGGFVYVVVPSMAVGVYERIYAQWTDADYYVVFDANGGDGTMADQEQITGIAGKLSGNVFTRDHHHFVGWAQSESGPVEYADGASICLPADPPFNADTQRYEYRLYAIWAENVYPVVYCSNDEHNYLKTNAVVVSENRILANTFPRQGYDFERWNTQADGSGNVYEPGQECLYIAPDFPAGLFLYAQWTAKSYRVTFVGNEGGIPSFGEKMVVYDQPYGELPTCAREGYGFLGWFTQQAGGDEITASTIVKITSGRSLYAHWAANTYKVTLNANGGSQSHPADTNIVFGTYYGDLPAAARIGYDFNGWWTAPDGGTRVWPDSVLRTAADHTLYAHWTVHRYAVAFEANGGEGTMDMLTAVAYDEPFALTSNAFVRVGYDFNHWTDAEGVHYADGETVSNLTAEAEATVTLSADWRPKTLTVTFDANGGSVAVATKEVVYATTYGELPTPSWSHHGFSGWWTDPVAGEQVLAATPVTITAAQTLYAHWRPPRQFKVTFAAGNGSVVDPLTVTEGETYPELPLPVRFGYDFLGWFTARSGGERIQAGEAIREEDLRLYAQWAECTSELSLALDTDFYFVSESSPVWFVTNLTGMVGGSAVTVCAAGTTYEKPAFLETRFESCPGGTLTFSWRAAYLGDGWAITEGQRLSLLINGVNDPVVMKQEDVNKELLEYSVEIPQGCTFIRFCYDYSGQGSSDCYAFIDHLRWEPNRPTVVEVGPNDTSVTVQEGQSLRFRKDGYDITGFLDFPEPVNGVVDLTRVTVKDDYVHEALDPAQGAVLVLDSASPSITTAPTREGLTYVLYEGVTLDGLKAGARTVGDGNSWTPAITVKGGASAFYTIKVTHRNE